MARQRPDIVHVQWAPLPVADALAMRAMRWFAPVVMTVHDTVPFNGERISFLQNAGFHLPIRAADHVIVHTAASKRQLAADGISAERIAVVPHGGLRLLAPMPARRPRQDGRYVFVLFGEIKPYKGLDLLVEAIALLPAETRAQSCFVVAGRARMDLSPVLARIAATGIADCVELRDRRHTDQEMAALFAQADCFLFPYRQIDASGVWFLTKSLGRWMIASSVGVFAEDMRLPDGGELVPPGDVRALAGAIERAVLERRAGVSTGDEDEWQKIGFATRAIYESLRRRDTRTPVSEAPS